MLHLYAQIDGAGICYAVTQAAGPIDAPDMVPLASYDLTLLGQHWTGSTWEPA